MVAHLERGDLDAALADMDEFERLATQLGQPLYTWYVPLWRGFRAHLRGDVPAMLGAAAEARTVGARAGSRNALVLSTVLEQWAAGEQLRLAEQLPVMMEVLGVLPELSPDGAGALAFFPGQPDHVRRAALPRLADVLDAMPRDAEWLSGLCHVAHALLEGGDEAEHCRVVYERLLPWAGLFAVDGIAVATYGAVDRWLAPLAQRLGLPEDAERHARDALAAHERTGSRLLVVHAQVVLAGVLADRGRADAAREARALAERALAGLRDMGLTARAEQVAARLSGVAADPASAGTAEPASEGCLARAGAFWTLTYRGATVTVPDSKGLRDLATLLARPGREVHVLDLDGAGLADVRVATAPDADLGEVLDAQARHEYATRLASLEEEIADAHEAGRSATAEALEAERESLVAGLRAAYGLGGRARRTGGEAERARSRVTRRIRDAVARLEHEHPDAGRHLRASVHTGVFCRYEPEVAVGWRVTQA